MPTAFHNLINGKWVDALSKSTLESVNPADTGDIIGTVPASGKEEIDRAVDAARAALPLWRSTPAPKRGEIIFRAAEKLLKHKDELGRLVTREMGKILSEGLGDVQEAIDMAYYMAAEGRRLTGETVPSELIAKDCKSVRTPVGVFGLITPWNFPTAIPAWKIFTCLIAGNTAVFKPSSCTPVAATRLVEMIHDAGLPPGVLNLVHGTGDGAGEALASHPGIDGLSFTGSTAVGERLLKTCASIGKEISCVLLGFVGKLAGLMQTVPLAVSGGLSIYLFGVIGMQGIALMQEHKVSMFNPRNLAVGAVIMVLGIGGNIGYPNGFLPIPFLQGIFPSGLPAIATPAVVGILLNAIFPIFKPATSDTEVLDEAVAAAD